MELQTSFIQSLNNIMGRDVTMLSISGDGIGKIVVLLQFCG